MPSVFSPITIGNLQLKNRVMMAPMENGLAEADGSVNDRLIEYYVERAKNEVAIAVTGSVAIAPEGRGLPKILSCYDDRFIPGLKRLVDAVHDAGSKMAAQIYHAGRQTSRMITGLEPVAPSAIPCPIMNDMPKKLTIDEIKVLIEKFGQGASRLMKAGFDMVEVHLAHGYLLTGFLSPFSNRRSDQYGGSLDNRMRFPVEVIRRIKEEVGSRMAVTARISADEFVEGGFTFEEAKKVCSAIVRGGIQAISISAGSYASIPTIIQPMSFPRGFLVCYAEEIKKIVDVPVIVAGRINNPALIEEIINQKKADMVAIGRALVADPEFLVKMKEGRAEDICPCVADNQGCADQVIQGKGINCILNARAGMETERHITPATLKKKVMVVGGGPAGMEASRVAALRGHTVMLIEREERLGGKVLTASKSPGKEEFIHVATYLENSIKKLGIEIRLEENDLGRAFKEFKPDVVILAAGSEPIFPDIPGLRGKKVVTAEDILNEKLDSGPKVVVIGGGKVGLETALFLAKKGKSVTVVEMLKEVAVDVGPIVKPVLMDELEKNNVAIVVNAQACEVRGDGLVCKQEEGFSTLIADTIVLAAGYRPVDQQWINRLNIEKMVIGDAKEARDVYAAVHDGFLAGSKV